MTEREPYAWHKQHRLQQRARLAVPLEAFTRAVLEHAGMALPAPVVDPSSELKDGERISFRQSQGRAYVVQRHANGAMTLRRDRRLAPKGKAAVKAHKRERRLLREAREHRAPQWQKQGDGSFTKAEQKATPTDG